MLNGRGRETESTSTDTNCAPGGAADSRLQVRRRWPRPNLGKASRDLIAVGVAQPYFSLFPALPACIPGPSHPAEMNLLRQKHTATALTIGLIASMLLAWSSSVFVERPAENQALELWLRNRLQVEPGSAVDHAIDAAMAEPIPTAREGLLRFARALIAADAERAAALAGSRYVSPEAVAQAVEDLGGRSIADAVVPRHRISTAISSLVSGVDGKAPAVHAASYATLNFQLPTLRLGHAAALVILPLRVLSSARPLGP